MINAFGKSYNNYIGQNNAAGARPSGAPPGPGFGAKAHAEFEAEVSRLVDHRRTAMQRVRQEYPDLFRAMQHTGQMK
jgi:hypothetical protein